MQNHAIATRAIQTLLPIVAILLPGIAPAATIVIAEDAPPPVRLAAREFAGALKHIHPEESFPVETQLPADASSVLLGAADSDPRIRSWASGRLAGPESFAVFVTNDGPRRIGVVAGADARGAACAAAALLEDLGCGFYLSGDALPPPRKGALPIDGWNLAGRPVARERIVFDWHNFLSGCSTWNAEHWRDWIRQAQLGGFNAVMVHAYGNNPMAAFAFDGVEKPVGYLSTTIKGRDWSTPHVNDVRRLWGGAVFDSPVFGPDAGMVPDAQRVAAARALMAGAFAEAEERAMDVYFAVDVDTPTANPPELVERLPESARFPVAAANPKDPKGPGKTVWLPNPETPEGYAYWKAQVDALMQHYPQIDCMVPWFRAGGTPWTAFTREELPPAWQREYASQLAQTPGAAGLKWSHNQFAIAKIVAAFRRALDAGGHRGVRVATGSWRFDFVPAADRFMPEGIPLIPLDYEVLHEKSQLRDAESRAVIREAGAHRPMIPVVWAHHDDGHYIGRPYTPFDAFQSKLQDANASGFGIIHWTTRPLDLYFESLARQTWSQTRDEPLAATCAHMAARLFGPSAAAAGGQYLHAWITGAPRFARETSDWVIDRRLEETAIVLRGCRERRALLDKVRTAVRHDGQRKHLAYFDGLEEFIAEFHETHGRYQQSRDAWAKGDTAEARRLMAECHPEPVIDRFANVSAAAGITRGEQGLVVALNLRWLTHIIAHRQALGLEPVRIDFAPTQHDPLAQSPGRFTFHFEKDRRVWQCLGTEETGAPAFDLGAAVADEILRTGIEISSAAKFTLQPMMCLSKKDLGPPPRLPAGRCRLRLTFLARAGTPPAAADVAIGSQDAQRIEITSASVPPAPVDREFPVEVTGSGRIDITITPARGTMRLCSAVLEPTADTR